MSDNIHVNVDLADLMVVLDKGDNYAVNIQNPSTVVINETMFYRVANYADSAGTASFALTASYVEGVTTSWDTLTNKPAGIVSSSTQVDYTLLQNLPDTIPTASFALTAVTASYVSGAISNWDSLANKPDGIVSSSTQVDYTLLQNLPDTIPTASFALTAVTASYVSGAVTSWDSLLDKPAGIISSSTQVDYTLLQNLPDTIPTASLALTAVTASYIGWNSIDSIPLGIVSSSEQINTGSFSGSFTGTLIGTSSWANDAISSSFATSASYAPTILPSGIVSSSAQVDYLQLQSIPSGIVSSSQQATLWSVATASYIIPSGLPVGIVSSSSQVDYTLLQNLPDTIPTASFALTAVTASYVSGAVTSWETLLDKPIGIVSSSTQVDYTLLLNIPQGIVSQSTQIVLQDTFGNISSSRIEGSVSSSLASLFASSSISSSYAETSSIALKVRILTGSIGDGTAAYTGSFTGSFYGDGSNLTGIASIISSGSVPSNPQESQLWYDNTTGKTYIYYVSGSLGSWVLQSDPTYDAGLVVAAATSSVTQTILASQPVTAQTGSIYFSSGFLYVYDGQKYVSASLN
jgi:hypothetical protein